MARNSRYKKKKIKREINKLDLTMFIINLLVTICLLLSYFSPDTDPRSFIYISLLGFVFPILVIVNLIFAIFWAIRKKVWASIAIIVCIVLGYNNINATIGFRGANIPPKNKEPRSLRMMAYNVNEFLTADRIGSTTRENIYELVHELDPDVLNLEEVTWNNDLQIDSLKQAMNAPYAFFKSFKSWRTAYFKKTAIGNEKMINIKNKGNAILSKYPIVDTGFVKGPDILNTHVIYVDIKKGNDTIRVYCVHLAPVQIETKEKEGYLKGNVSVSKSSFIADALSAAFIKRSYQVDKIKENIDSCVYPRIIAGDFNDTPVSYSVNTIGNGLKNCFQEKGSGYGTTFYSKFLLHVDHILVSPRFDVLNYEALDKLISDHKPVISDLILK